MKTNALDVSNVKASGKWVALGLMILTSVVLNLPYAGYSPALTEIMADMNINYTQASLLSSLTAIISGVAVLFGGVLVDKWSPAKAIILSLLILAVGELIFAISPNYGVMLSSRVIIGLGVTPIYAGSMALAIRWFDGSDKKGLGIGSLLSSDGLGAMFGLYVFGFLMTALGWRTGNIAGSIAVAAVCILCFFKLKDHPSFNVEKEAMKKNPESASGDSFFKIIFRKNVIIPACYIIGYIGGYSVALYWVPTILVEQGWSASMGGLIGALWPFAGILGAVASGAVSDKMGRRKPLVLMAGALTTLSFLLLVYAVSTGNYLLMAILLPIGGFASYIGSPQVYIWAADEVGTRNVGTANGFILGCGFLIGGSLFPLIVGAFKDMVGTYTAGFLISTILIALLNLIIPAFLKEEAQAKL